MASPAARRMLHGSGGDPAVHGVAIWRCKRSRFVFSLAPLRVCGIRLILKTTERETLIGLSAGTSEWRTLRKTERAFTAQPSPRVPVSRSHLACGGLGTRATPTA